MCSFPTLDDSLPLRYHPPRRCSTLRLEFDLLGGIVNSLAFIPTLGYEGSAGFLLLQLK
jgi:hypothetical protein